MTSFFVGAALLAASPSSAPAKAWEWRGVATELDLDLVRADVRIVPTSGEASVHILPTGADAAAATLVSIPDRGALRIRDSYPARGASFTECLPPDDERGDFWNHVVPMQVVIAVPAATRVRVRLMSGDITVAASGSRFDLQTSSGAISRPRS